MLVTHWLQSCGPLRALAACRYPVCQHPHGSKLTTVVHTPTLSTSLSTPSLRHANHTWAQCAPHIGAPPASSHTSPHCEAASNSRYRHTCRTQHDPVSVSPSDEPLGDLAHRQRAVDPLPRRMSLYSILTQFQQALALYTSDTAPLPTTSTHITKSC